MTPDKAVELISKEELEAFLRKELRSMPSLEYYVRAQTPGLMIDLWIFGLRQSVYVSLTELRMTIEQVSLNLKHQINYRLQYLAVVIIQAEL